MSNLTTLGSNLQAVQNQLNEEQLKILQKTFCKDATNMEMKLFSQVCSKSGLDPFSKQIYMIKRQGQITFQTAIDGFRAIAERSGLYEGQEDAVYFDSEGKSYEIWTKKDPPYAARVGVFKKGLRSPVRAIALFHEYKPAANDFMWKKMPSLMIAKCAESLALRKAFPSELSGLHTNEEMEQANNKPVHIQAEVKPAKKETVINEMGELPPTQEDVINPPPQDSEKPFDFRPLVIQKIVSLIKNEDGEINGSRLAWLKSAYKFQSSKEIETWPLDRAAMVFSDIDMLTVEDLDKLSSPGQ